MKIIAVELYYCCRSDIDARALAQRVASAAGGHLGAEQMRCHLLHPPNEEKDLQWSGYSWTEKETQ